MKQKKTPKTQTNLYDDRESNRTSERYNGAENSDPRRTTIHLIYMMQLWIWNLYE